MITTVLLIITTLCSSPAKAFTAPPSWEALQSTPSLANRPSPPIYHDALPESIDSSLPVLYRDKDCICAACESVWLALEVKNVDYVTVLLDTKNTPEDNEGQPMMVPHIKWPSTNDDSNDDDGSITADPVQLLEQIQSRYPDSAPQFYPSLSSAVDASRCNILRLPG
eukprot:scaffold6240_cov101-Skeletonema_menzelii.AAC.1